MMETKMERSIWLKEIRRVSEEQETLLAPIYDENWGSIALQHQQFFDHFLSLCPPQGYLIDAACGTGKYWPLILASGRTVFGIDQSQGVLVRAHEKFPDVPTEKVGMQEMDYHEAFSGAVCMDALEMVCPEDWPIVMRNFHRAIQAGGYFYFTVELTTEQDIQDAFAEGQQMGLPVVYGETEWLDEGGYAWGRAGCYHYYPKIGQVKEWIRQAGFQLIEETVGDGYHHFLVQKQ